MLVRGLVVFAALPRSYIAGARWLATAPSPAARVAEMDDREACWADTSLDPVHDW